MREFCWCPSGDFVDECPPIHFLQKLQTHFEKAHICLGALAAICALRLFFLIKYVPSRHRSLTAEIGRVESIARKDAFCEELQGINEILSPCPHAYFVILPFPDIQILMSDMSAKIRYMSTPRVVLFIRRYCIDSWGTFSILGCISWDMGNVKGSYFWSVSKWAFLSLSYQSHVTSTNNVSPACDHGISNTFGDLDAWQSNALLLSHSHVDPHPIRMSQSYVLVSKRKMFHVMGFAHK